MIFHLCHVTSSSFANGTGAVSNKSLNTLKTEGKNRLVFICQITDIMKGTWLLSTTCGNISKFLLLDKQGSTVSDGGETASRFLRLARNPRLELEVEETSAKGESFPSIVGRFLCTPK